MSRGLRGGTQFTAKTCTPYMPEDHGRASGTFLLNSTLYNELRTVFYGVTYCRSLISTVTESNMVFFGCPHLFVACS